MEDQIRRTYVIGDGVNEDAAPVGLIGLSNLDQRSKSAKYWVYIGEADNRRRGLASKATALILDFGFNTLGLHLSLCNRKEHGGNQHVPQVGLHRGRGCARACLFSGKILQLAVFRLVGTGVPRVLHARGGVERLQRTILVIGAGPLQIPAIEEAAVLGLRTVAVDANPKAPGMARANACHVVDILDGDAVTAIARAEKVDGVMTLCTDAPVRTVAAVAAALGLRALSPAAAANATDKRLMRKVLRNNGVSVPLFEEVESAEKAQAVAGVLGFPLALKVPCSSGSRGVYRVENEEDLGKRFVQAREFYPQGNLLMEEWMDGAEVSVEGACCGERVHVVQVTDKLLFAGAFPVEAGHTQPSQLPEATVAQIRSTTETGVRALGLSDCAFHAELKITRDGPKIVEIGARLGGDRISTHLTPLSTGVNLVRAAILIALGQEPEVVPSIARGAAVRYFRANGCGLIESIEGLDELSSLPGLELLYAGSERDGPLRPGLVIHEVCSSLDRIGHVVFSGEDAAQSSARAEDAASRVKFHCRAIK